MEFKLKPVIVVGPMWPLIPQPDGSLQLSTDEESITSTITGIDAQIREHLESQSSLLETLVIRQEEDIESLEESGTDADALFVYIAGLMESLEGILDLSVPTITFSGEYTPMMGLYAFPVEEREARENLNFCLDYEEVKTQIRMLLVKKQITSARIIHIGLPATLDGHWEHVPDPDKLKEKLGMEVIPVTSAEFISQVGEIDESMIADLVQSWLSGASEVDGPSTEEVNQVAKVYLAIDGCLKSTGANAVAVGCLQLMYMGGLVPHCFALSQLRDRGIPAACESDISALVTMIMLGYLANKPAYMGNVARADPSSNIIMISHGCTPSRMAGLDQSPSPYKLVHSYSGQFFTGSGLTSLPVIETGQEVTVARISRNLDKLSATTGTITGFRETFLDRGTMDIRIGDVRRFFHNAPGNHHVVVYGNHIEQLRHLCQLLDIRLVES